jgi:hypothetical protein
MNWRKRKKILKQRMWHSLRKKANGDYRINGSNKSLHTMRRITGRNLRHESHAD